MRKASNLVFTCIVSVFAAIMVAALAFVLYFIVREALPLFEQTTLKEFLFGQRWMPIAYAGEPSFGIFNFMAGTLFVSFVAMALALFTGLGAAAFLSFAATERTRSLLYPLIDLLAGIPSVVYGFVGLMVLVKLFIRAGVHTGSCVLAAGILLSVMLLPFLISSCSETMLRMKERYLLAGTALGVDKWYMLARVILPASRKNILLSMVLAIGRAMGETMAVMMVMGNANLFPRLLGKGESIAAVIALEMGTAVAGSPHYHALYAAGLVLVVLLLLINTVINVIRRRLLLKEGC